MSSLCISRTAWPAFTDAKCARMDMIFILPCRNFSADSCRRKLPLKFTQTKSSFLNTRMLEKNYLSSFAWPVKCTVLKLQDVVRRVSSAGTRYMGRKQTAYKTPHKESKAHQVTNKSSSTRRSTDLGKTIDKYACEASWTALRMRGIWPRCCMSRRVQESVTEH
jgi:hypothetical protein